MTTPSDATQQTKAERWLGLGSPAPRSRLYHGGFALLAIFLGGAILWGVLSGAWDEEEGFVPLGLFSMLLYQLCDAVGAFLYLWRGASWGRSLRVFGCAVFLPLSLALWAIDSWVESSPMFPLFALVLGGFVAVVAVRGAAMLRRDAGERGGR